jgi:hypothetical protein
MTTSSTQDAEVMAKADLTRDQQTVLNMALEGASLFIGGEAGTGKSFLLREIATALSKQGLHVAVTAATGIAALNIGGNTFHSSFGIPLPAPDDFTGAPPLARSRACLRGDTKAARKGEEEGEDEWAHDAEVVLRNKTENDIFQNGVRAKGASVTLRKPQRLRFNNTAALATVDVVIIDEVSMLHAGFLESLERALRHTSGRNPFKPFGGVQMILSGDFMQLTPFASLCTSFGSSRQTTPVGKTDSARGERKVCRGVQRPRPPFPCGGEHVPSKEGKPAEEPTGLAEQPTTETDVDFMCCGVLKERERCGTTQQQLRRPPRRRKEVWYYDKPMFESWCFHQHLLHVQLCEPQRHSDVAFAAELNALRRGELPFRLSRCAYLNPADDTAVRLLPTKAAVKNFNDRRMLELDGESRVFRTQLTMMDATSLTELTKGRDKGTRQTLACRSTLLLQYRLCSLLKSRDAPSCSSRRCYLTHEELRRAERAIEEHCKLPAHSVQLRTLPVPLTYSTSLSTIHIECVARSKGAAQARRAVVQAALHKCAVQHDARAFSGASMLNSKHAAVTSSAPLLFPREVVRVEPVEWSQLLHRLQPAMQHYFRIAIRKDTVLQDKTFKVGCRVMLLRNLSTTYVNGSLGTITRYLPATECAELLPADMKAVTAHQLSLLPTTLLVCADQITLKDEAAVLPIVRMDSDGKEVAIPWVVLTAPVVHDDWCYTLRATCIPLTPAYAFTVHKIQGVTLNHPVLFDADGMFPCDHLVYVAASRVRKFEQLRMINLTPRMVSVHVPSLRFTAGIPSVDRGRQMWEAWRSAPPRSSVSLFWPSHVKSPQRRCSDGNHH